MSNDKTVKLCVYDLSGGLASSLSMQFIGKQIDGIWYGGLTAFIQLSYISTGILELLYLDMNGIGVEFS